MKSTKAVIAATISIISIDLFCTILGLEIDIANIIITGFLFHILFYVSKIYEQLKSKKEE